MNQFILPLRATIQEIEGSNQTSITPYFNFN
ncbi:MAG: hypothetical protein RIS64_2540 [Bacteroidota bacterium]|jgi:hypothetical protein